MKRAGWFIVMLAALGMVGVLQPNAKAEQINAAVAPGEFVVKFAPGVTEKQQTMAINARGGVIKESIPELGVVIAQFKQSKSADAARMAELVRALESDDVVEYAEPNWVVSLAQEPVAQPSPEVTAAQPSPEVTAAQGTRRWIPVAQGLPILVPNDPNLGSQYAWNNIGAFRAWGLNTGAASVMIAVIDSGVDLTHPDLASKIVAGYDFVDQDGVAQDDNGHGTHVAGIAAAATNNGVGVAGTCPGCTILPVRVLDESGNGFLSDVIAGIRYAADRGAKVINLSLTGPASRAEEDAVNYAWSKGSVMVCAAGNSGTSSTSRAYPAASPNCIAVAATNGADAKASFSNYGGWVDIAAPGAEIYSTYIPNDYEVLSGTSMASPYVAGAAGLLAARGLNNGQIRARLEGTADKIAGTGTLWTSGRLNIQSAVR